MFFLLPCNKFDFDVIKNEHEQTSLMKRQLGFRGHLDLEPVQQFSQTDLHLIHRKPLTDAGPISTSKSSESERNNVARIFSQKSFWLELFRLREKFFIVMRRPGRNENSGSLFELDSVDFNIFGAQSEIVSGRPVQS